MYKRQVSYCIYSGIISLVVYPIEAGWVWNSQGWLAQLGFHDFAGSAAIHSVGGLTALIGAIMVGPRLGKYVKDKAGKVKKVNAIPGHSITPVSYTHLDVYKRQVGNLRSVN